MLARGVCPRGNKGLNKFEKGERIVPSKDTSEKRLMLTAKTANF